MNNDLLDIIMCHLTTKAYHDSHLIDTYCTKITHDLYVVYYLLDIPEKEETPKPIDSMAVTYITTEIVKELGISEDDLLNRTLSNTQTLLGVEIYTVSQYLQSLIDSTTYSTANWLTKTKINLLKAFIEQTKDTPTHDNIHMLTNDLFFNGSIGIFFPQVLRNFCLDNGFKKIFIQPGNPDYAFLACADSPENNIRFLDFLKSAPSISTPENTAVLNDTIYLYDSITNELEIVTE